MGPRLSAIKSAIAAITQLPQNARGQARSEVVGSVSASISSAADAPELPFPTLRAVPLATLAQHVFADPQRVPTGQALFTPDYPSLLPTDPTPPHSDATGED